MKKAKQLFSLLMGVLLFSGLAGCTDDAASYMVDGRYHSLSLAREQPYFWESKVKYSFVVTRLPDCQRKHYIALGNPLARTELWDLGNNAYLLKQSNRMYVTETRTCEGFAPLAEVPDTGMGTLLGTFQEKDGEFRFRPAPNAPKAEAVAQ